MFAGLPPSVKVAQTFFVYRYCTHSDHHWSLCVSYLARTNRGLILVLLTCVRVGSLSCLSGCTTSASPASSVLFPVPEVSRRRPVSGNTQSTDLLPCGAYFPDASLLCQNGCTVGGSGCSPLPVLPGGLSLTKERLCRRRRVLVPTPFSLGYETKVVTRTVLF